MKLNKCDICGDEFSETKKKHRDRYHSENRTYFDCHICNSRYLTKDGLTHHVTKVHEKKLNLIKCDLCDKTLSSREGMKYHKLIDHSTYVSPKCYVCGNTFKSKQVLLNHFRNVHKVSK